MIRKGLGAVAAALLATTGFLALNALAPFQESLAPEETQIVNTYVQHWRQADQVQRAGS